MIVQREHNCGKAALIGTLSNLLFVIVPFYVWQNFGTALVSVDVMVWVMLGFALACGIVCGMFGRDCPPYWLWLIPFSIYLEANLLVGKWLNVRLLLYCAAAGIAAIVGWALSAAGKRARSGGARTQGSQSHHDNNL